MGGDQLAVKVILPPEIVGFSSETGVLIPQIHEAEVFKPRPFHGLRGLSDELLQGSRDLNDHLLHRSP